MLLPSRSERYKTSFYTISQKENLLLLIIKTAERRQESIPSYLEKPGICNVLRYSRSLVGQEAVEAWLEGWR